MAEKLNQGQIKTDDGVPQNPYHSSLPENDLASQKGSPRSLGKALPKLPKQYIKALTKPSVATFAEDMGKASWGVVWVQLLGWALIAGILRLATGLISPLNLNPTTSSGSLSPTTLLAFTLANIIGMIILIPMVFFLGMGIMYLLAKAFGGQGIFLEQSYTSLQFQVPLNIVGNVLALLPFVGWLLSLVLGIYGIVLQVFAIMAVHRLSRGKAIAVVLIPLAVVLVLVSTLIITFLIITLRK